MKYTPVFAAIGIPFILFACATQSVIPMNYSSVLINSIDQKILFLAQDHILNSRGDTLATYEGNELKNHIGQTIGYVEGTEIFNLQRQQIGQIEGGEVLIPNGKPIMRVEGGTVTEQAKVGAGIFFFL